MIGCFYCIKGIFELCHIPGIKAEQVFFPPEQIKKIKLNHLSACLTSHSENTLQTLIVCISREEAPEKKKNVIDFCLGWVVKGLMQ